MSTPALRLKNTRGWFAAGAEVQKAFELLSDGCFKLFVYICLNARRDTGILNTTQTELARNLKKTHGTIRKLLHEMETAGICRSRFCRSPVKRGTVQITEPFWPYERGADQAAPDDPAGRFVSDVRKILAERACVRAPFSTADEILARKWFDQGVTLERVEQAILLGCARKYVAWRNNQAHGPISSLRYFESVLEEIAQQKIDPEYWGFLRFRMPRHEKLWIQGHQKDTVPDNTDANTPTSTVTHEGSIK